MNDANPQPSSAPQTTASDDRVVKQIYVTGGSEALAYLDDVRWWRS